MALPTKQRMRKKSRYPKLPKAPVSSDAAVRASMKGNRAKGTSAETRLADILLSRGLSGFVANHSDLPGSPDFSFRQERVAVFVNGCYWHRCPYCKPNFPKSNRDYWEAKFHRNIVRDKQNRSDLREMGWKPVVVWECKLAKHPSRITRRIQCALESSRG